MGLLSRKASKLTISVICIDDMIKHNMMEFENRFWVKWIYGWIMETSVNSI